MRRAALLALLCTVAMGPASPALAGGGPSGEPSSVQDRVEELQQELDSLIEEVDDLREPVAEFDLFDQCMYAIGVTQHDGYRFGEGGRTRRPALALDLRGFGRPQYQFLAFPGEEPPSIECNEDAGQESIDS